MTTNVIAHASNTFVADAARFMRRERIGAIPIVDGGRFVEILTRSDVLDAFAELSQRGVPPATREPAAALGADLIRARGASAGSRRRRRRRS